jgi:hypothetical protein
MAAEYELVHAPKFLRERGWPRLLRNWASCLDEYSTPENGEPRDFAYWYGERPLTGLLASAAWRLSRGWGLEEFATPRGRGRNACIGRGDLWLGTNGASFTVEAKITWPSRDTESAKEYVRRRLTHSRCQLESLDRKFKHGSLIALCYVVPEPTAGRHTSRVIDEMFSDLPAHFAKDPYAVATYRHRDPLPHYGKRAYPGVILIAELCKRHDDA